ncbi:MAG: protoporphyrinogen oxidase [Desulfobulbus propionicus]|nr:MAG: protoporphyrinogen oxidase [Desulfobulbus propionicus]
MKHYDVCIIGAGLSGLSTAAFLLKGAAQKRIFLLDKGAVPGGVISTFQQDGYLAEWGPHGFLDTYEECMELVEWAGLEEDRLFAPLGKYVRYICLNGKLNEIAQQPHKIITRPLISVPAKLRVLGEVWKKPLEGEPTIAQWVEHRFGSAMLPFADAVFTGTYAGDIHRLKMDAVMPGARRLELEYGSIIKGLVRRMMQKRGSGHRRKGLPSMTSFVHGMEQFPLALAEKVSQQAEISCNTEVTGIKRTSSGWLVYYGENSCQTSHLVLALPVNTCLELLQKMESEQAKMPLPPVRKIPETRLVNVLLGFDTSAEIPFGFGYLAPEQEKRFALGGLFSSHMYPGRAPEGRQLVEVMVGGRRHEKRLELDDAALVSAVCRDLKELVALPKAPVFSKVLRSAGSLPQLEQGYTSLLAWRDQIMELEPTLFISGFGWKGIGIYDMTSEAKKTAERILTQKHGSGKAEVKGVYF